MEVTTACCLGRRFVRTQSTRAHATDVHRPAVLKVQEPVAVRRGWSVLVGVHQGSSAHGVVHDLAVNAIHDDVGRSCDDWCMPDEVIAHPVATVAVTRSDDVTLAIVRTARITAISIRSDGVLNHCEAREDVTDSDVDEW